MTDTVNRADVLALAKDFKLDRLGEAYTAHKLEQAIRALPAAPGWQDIATAPTEAQREMIKASAQNLLDLLMKRHGLENTVSRDEVQVMWDDVKDEVGFAAVKAFLEAVAILPAPPS